MANLTEEEDKELKRAGMDESEIRRDFSVIHSKSMKKNHLFLGPARFVNVSAAALPSVFFSFDTFPDSTIVTTTVNYSERVAISHSEFSGRLRLVKRLRLTMGIPTVRKVAVLVTIHVLTCWGGQLASGISIACVRHARRTGEGVMHQTNPRSSAIRPTLTLTSRQAQVTKKATKKSTLISTKGEHAVASMLSRRMKAARRARTRKTT